MKRRYILLLSALVLFTGAVIMTGCPANVKPQTPKYKVTLNSGKHGTVTVKPSLPADGMVGAHTRLSFTAQPDEGYEVDTWIMAAPRSADKKEAALTVAEKTTVTVTFKPKIKKYKIMLNKNEYGTVTVSPALPADGMVEQYKTLTFTATPNEGYEVEWTGAAPDNTNKNKATLTVTANAVVTATFKKPGNNSELQNYHVALNKNEYGTVTVSPALPADGMVEQYKTLTFTAQPDEGYEVEWTGAAPDNADKNKATLTVTANAVVTATFKKPGNSSEVQNYHVALSSGSNGTLIADTPLPADGMVAAGSILTFTATPDSAYEVEAWTGAVANPSDSTKATLTVTAHTTVSVTFKEKQANIALLNIDAGGYLKGVIDKDALVGDLIIPDTVTSISDYAFADCQGLTSVTIPNGVTSIGRYTFYDCLNLTHITIPDSVTEIEQLAFIGCSGLISITIPNGVTSIGDRAFEGCRKLTNIILPSSLTSIQSETFKDCKSLTNITIPDKVTIISSDAFENCVGLTQISIPSSVTKIDARAFKRCSKLKQISIPNSVTIIGIGAFYRCTGLTNITLGTGVTTINQAAFQDCKNLTSIIIPNSVSKIESWAFMDCDKLTSVTFENTAGWKVFASRTIAPEDLADASKAAKYLRNRYLDANWTRN